MDINYDNDNNLNAKFQLKYEDLIQDLDGIQRNDLEWSIKTYRVDIDIITTNLEWIVKRYRCDNKNNNYNSRIPFRSAVYHDGKNDDNTNKRLKELLLRMVKDAVNTELEYILKQY